MKKINNFLIERLKLNNVVPPSIKIKFPKVDIKDQHVNNETWREFNMPINKFLIIKDCYRGDCPHLMDFSDFMLGIAYSQDDMEGFNFDKDILYSSDDLQDILEWYFKYVKADIPHADDDCDDWAYKNEKYFKHCCDDPLILAQMYLGEDHYYDNVKDVNPDDWDTKEKVIDQIERFI